MWRSTLDQRYYITKEIEKRKVIDPIKLDNWKFVPEEWTKDAIERDKKILFD